MAIFTDKFIGLMQNGIDKLKELKESEYFETRVQDHGIIDNTIVELGRLMERSKKMKSGDFDKGLEQLLAIITGDKIEYTYIGKVKYREKSPVKIWDIKLTLGLPVMYMIASVLKKELIDNVKDASDVLTSKKVKVGSFFAGEKMNPVRLLKEALEGILEVNESIGMTIERFSSIKETQQFLKQFNNFDVDYRKAQKEGSFTEEELSKRANTLYDDAVIKLKKMLNEDTPIYRARLRELDHVPKYSEEERRELLESFEGNKQEIARIKPEDQEAIKEAIKEDQKENFDEELVNKPMAEISQLAKNLQRLVNEHNDLLNPDRTDFRQLLVDSFAVHQEDAMNAYQALYEEIRSKVKQYAESGAGSTKGKKVDPEKVRIMAMVSDNLEGKEMVSDNLEDKAIKYQYPEDALPKMLNFLYKGYEKICDHSLTQTISPGGSAKILLDAIKDINLFHNNHNQALHSNSRLQIAVETYKTENKVEPSPMALQMRSAKH